MKKKEAFAFTETRKLRNTSSACERSSRAYTRSSCRAVKMRAKVFKAL